MAENNNCEQPEDSGGDIPIRDVTEGILRKRKLEFLITEQDAKKCRYLNVPRERGIQREGEAPQELFESEHVQAAVKTLGDQISEDESDVTIMEENCARNWINWEEALRSIGTEDERFISCSSQETLEELDGLTKPCQGSLETSELPQREKDRKDVKENCASENSEVECENSDAMSEFGSAIAADEHVVESREIQGNSSCKNASFTQSSMQPKGSDLGLYDRRISEIAPTKHQPVPGSFFPLVPDIPVSKVHLKNSSDVHIGPRINYVKEVHPPPSSSTQDSEDHMKSDEAIRPSSAKLRLGYSTVKAYMASGVCFGKSHDFSIKDCYRQPKIDEYNNSGNLKRSNIQLKDIFTSERQEVPATRILLTGNLGCGKTSTLKKMAYDWSTLNSENNYLSHFDVLLIIHLSTLLDRTMEDMILDALFEEKHDKKKETLHRTKLRFLILLDGFDYLGSSAPVVDFLTARKSYSFSANMAVVLTSRMHCVTPIKKCFQCHFHIEGFDEDGVEEYINFRFSTKPYLEESLKSKLKEQLPLKAISRNPLMLHMVCCLHEEGNLNGHTSTYTEIFRGLVRRFYQKYGWSRGILKRGKHLLGEDLLIKFGRIAMMYLKGEICCFNSSLLRQEFHNQEEYEFITQLGHLVSSQECQSHLYFSFESLHTAFLEFTAAVYLIHNPSDLQSFLLCQKDKHISRVVIYLMDMYDNTDILLAQLDRAHLNTRMSFDDYCCIIKEVNDPDPFLETLDIFYCNFLGATAENVFDVLSYGKTENLYIYFNLSEYTEEFLEVMFSIRQCNSLSIVHILKVIPVFFIPVLDEWHVWWLVDFMDEFEHVKEMVNLDMEAIITVNIDPILSTFEVQGEFLKNHVLSELNEDCSEIDIVPRHSLPEHKHVTESQHCYDCALADQHEVIIACDGMIFVLPLLGYNLFDDRYTKTVIFRVPEKDHSLFEEPGRFLEIAEGFLANNINVEIW